MLDIQWNYQQERLNDDMKTNQEQYTKQIPCPEHAQGGHTATLYLFGHKYAGLWECPVSGASEACEHVSTHIETVEVTNFPTPDIDASYDTEVYVCDLCGCTVDGNPAEDRADAQADAEIMNALDK